MSRAPLFSLSCDHYILMISAAKQSNCRTNPNILGVSRRKEESI